MNNAAICFAGAAVTIALMPLVPRLLRFRIKALRFIHWNWLADLHERHFAGFVIGIRIIMIAIVLLLLYLGFAGLY